MLFIFLFLLLILFCFHIPCLSIDGFREGYLNDFLPGNPIYDTRNLPNVPFTTDTNRFSDGITSTSYFGEGSPAFPLYVAPEGLADTSGRVKNYVNYMDNARWQGLAGYHQGNARQEEAKLDFLDQFSLNAIKANLLEWFADMSNSRTVETDKDPTLLVVNYDIMIAEFLSTSAKMTVMSILGYSPFYKLGTFRASIEGACKFKMTLREEGSPSVVVSLTNTSLLDPSKITGFNLEHLYNSYYDVLYNISGNPTSELPLPPKPTKTFPVFAAIKWNPSDFAIQENEEYEISAVAPLDAEYTAQTWNDGGIRVDANGYDAHYDAISNCYVAIGRCRSYLKTRRRLETANWMSLICSVGEYVRNVQEVMPSSEIDSRFIPIDESRVQKTQFVVGKKTTFISKESGQLICFANDAHTLYWNNGGKIDVTVTRLSWPPKSDAYYKDLKLPACDSALAVYKNKGNWSLENGCNPKGGGAGWDMKNVLPENYIVNRTMNYTNVGGAH